MEKMNQKELIAQIKEVIEKDKKILFAFLYGSYALNTNHPKSDIDIAVYIKPSDMDTYIQKQKELTDALVAKLHTDRVDLRILNTLPFLLKYRVVKEGISIKIKDESEKVDFETKVMNRYFELKPYLEEYNRMTLERLKQGL